MANHTQALKRHRQNLTRNARNRARRSMMKTAIRKASEAFVAGGETAEALLRKAIGQISRARTKGLIHKNTAARRVANITKAFHKTQG
ncbi:MAG: 30S ribosomal protein S20 [Pseudomonadota bacterium]